MRSYIFFPVSGSKKKPTSADLSGTLYLCSDGSQKVKYLNQMISVKHAVLSIFIIY